MPATLTASGINFNDSTSATSRSSFFAPAGTVCLFYRSTAPTGWTTLTSHNDKMLRIVTIGSGSGGGFGGTNSFSNTFANRGISANGNAFISGLSVGATTLDVNTIPVHAHPANSGGTVSSGRYNPGAPGFPGSRSIQVAPGNTTGNNGNSGSHAHPAGYSSAPAVWSTNIDMRLGYIDIILCSFNG